MSKYESPIYEVLEKHDHIEIRHYDAFATVKYTTSEDPYAQAAFQTLFRYIQGDNQSSASIAMTVPVYQDFKEKGMTMSFVVPKKYLLGIPKPNHPDLHIDHFLEGFYAAITFSGSQNIANLRQHQTELLLWLKQKHYSMTSDVIAAFYNAPFTLPFLKRNELMVKIDYTPIEENK